MASKAKKYYAGNGNYYTLENGRMVLRRQNGTAIYRNGKLVTSNKVSYIQKRDKQKKSNTNKNNKQSSNTSSTSSTSSNTDTASSNNTNNTDENKKTTNKIRDIEYDLDEFTPETPYTQKELLPTTSKAHFVMLDVYETDEENYTQYQSNGLDSSEDAVSNTTTEDDKKEDEDKKEEEDDEETVDIDSLLEEAKKESSDDEENGFYPHLGEIKETHNYYQTFNASYDGDYSGFKNSGKISFPPLDKEDLKHIYKGVRCLLKYGRFTPDNENKEIIVNPVFLSFITEESFNRDNVEISLEDEGLLLEDKEELTFTDTLRSEILKEVIRSAGLTPEVDFHGLQDEIISWTSVTSSGGGSKSNLTESTTHSDCSSTYELSDGLGCKVSKRGALPSNIQDKAFQTVGKSGTNYANAVKGMDYKGVIKHLRSLHHYRSYRDNDFKCASESYGKHLNCGDSARLLKCCMDTIGQACICIHCPNHYYNAIRVNGVWKTVDLCYSSDLGKEGTTNSLGV